MTPPPFFFAYVGRQEIVASFKDGVEKPFEREFRHLTIGGVP